MNPTAISANREEESAEILIPAIGYWRHLRTKIFLLFCQNHGLFRHACAKKDSGIKAALSRAADRIIWWLFSVPVMGVAALTILAMSFPLFLFNKQSYRYQNCQPTIRINRVGNHVVVGFEAWSVFLHPTIFCLRSIGSDWVICHPIWPSDRPFVLIPKKAIPAEWTSRLFEQIHPKPKLATAAA